MDDNAKILAESKKKLIQYLPFDTFIDSTFWFEIKRLKLDDLKLDIRPINVNPSCSLKTSNPGLVTLNYESFSSYEALDEEREKNLDYDGFMLNGKLIIYNTKEEFLQADKRILINNEGKFIWDSMIDQTKQKYFDSNLEYFLIRFFMIVFGDFKNYDFYFWCAYPSLSFPPNCFQSIEHNPKWTNNFNFEQSEVLIKSIANLPIKQRIFFVIILKPKQQSINNDDKLTYFQNFNLEIMLFDEFWSIETLKNLSTIQDLKILFAYNDYSNYANYPGWLLRNYLSYIYVRLGILLKNNKNDQNLLSLVQTILFQDYLKMVAISIPRQKYIEPFEQSDLNSIFERSFVHRIALLPSNFRKIKTQSYLEAFITDINKLFESSKINNDNNNLIDVPFVPPAVGWERNKELNNRVIYNKINCSETLDPEKMASDALNLNLKLMKWRLATDLDLEIIKNTKCLLLGSGTLGCNVARSLVAWGINHITMVDNKNVSFSNPARQSLFTYKDATNGNRSKAEAAVEALKMINPGLEATGINLNIKMPGHSFKNSFEEEFKEIDLLDQLIENHDVIFLMTDTRESRWLPTLIATSKHKIVINVALGFDSFVVQRFGVRLRNDDPVDRESSIYPIYNKQMRIYEKLFPSLDASDSPFLLSNEIGCYFCQDINAPSDSTKDRTLDQQCTVTRPGLSMIASGYAVELLICLLNHPAGVLAPVLVGENSIIDKLKTINDKDDANLLNNDSIMGSVVQQIRGFLSRFQLMLPISQRLECCTACSFTVIDHYRNDRENFLKQAINESNFLEKLTGIDKFYDVEHDIIPFDESEEE